MSVDIMSCDQFWKTTYLRCHARIGRSPNQACGELWWLSEEDLHSCFQGGHTMVTATFALIHVVAVVEFDKQAPNIPENMSRYQ